MVDLVIAVCQVVGPVAALTITVVFVGIGLGKIRV